jgi:hypothetical protein
MKAKMKDKPSFWFRIGQGMTDPALNLQQKSLTIMMNRETLQKIFLIMIGLAVATLAVYWQVSDARRP